MHFEITDPAKMPRSGSVTFAYLRLAIRTESGSVLATLPQKLDPGPVLKKKTVTTFASLGLAGPWIWDNEERM